MSRKIKAQQAYEFGSRNEGTCLLKVQIKDLFPLA